MTGYGYKFDLQEKNVRVEERNNDDVEFPPLPNEPIIFIEDVSFNINFWYFSQSIPFQPANNDDSESTVTTGFLGGFAHEIVNPGRPIFFFGNGDQSESVCFYAFPRHLWAPPFQDSTTSEEEDSDDEEFLADQMAELREQVLERNLNNMQLM